jgi:hypothetical protein
MDIFSAGGILAVVLPFIIQAVKKISWIGSSKAPLVAFLLGALSGLAAYLFKITPEGMSLIQALLAGIAIGGTSTGLYDFVKKTTLTTTVK